MADTYRYGLADVFILLLPLLLILSPNSMAQDANAGRELFEREWEFVESAAPFTQWDTERPMPRQRSRGRGRGRGHRPDYRDQDQALTSVLPAEDTGFPADGLGPLHNAVSCAACHPGGGASGVNHNVTHITVDPRSPFFAQPTDRAGRGNPRNSVLDLFPALMSGNTLVFNTVVHDRSTRPGYQAIRQGLEVGVPNGLTRQWFMPEERTVEAIAAQPVVAGRYGTLDYYLSQRNSTPLYGMGAIERISANWLKAVARSQNRASGGTISGRVAGKYGWRGQVDTLAGFVAGACATELGLNVAGIAQQANDPADPRYRSLAADISTTQVAQLTSYVADLPAPSQPLLSAEERKRVHRGEQLFSVIGCAACHIADMQPARGIYSDLLLHDMGAELQDPAPAPAPAHQLVNSASAAPAGAYQNRYGRTEPASYGSGSRRSRNRSASSTGNAYVPAATPQTIAMDYPEQPQFPRGEVDPAELKGRHRFSWDALQREWKTPPLWGVADSAPYLHDGRAATLAEAIQWHGGEAEQAKREFVQLNTDQKELLLAFLESLKAPQQSFDRGMIQTSNRLAAVPR